MEREKAGGDTAVVRRSGVRLVIGSAPGSGNCEALSTVASPAGGLARSSGEAPVMGVERRGQVIYECSHEQPEPFRLWEDAGEQVKFFEQVVYHTEAAGVGGVPTSRGQ